MSWTQTYHDSADALAEALAAQLAESIGSALAGRGRAVLALAGGHTPFPVYRRLVQAPLDWGKVTVLPTDERWVSHDHQACNWRELRAAFSAAAGAHVLPLTPAELLAPVSAALAQETLAALPAPFDLSLLGMGDDGHFASLFPGAAELAAGLDLHDPDDALVVNPNPLPPDAPYPRISLGAGRLLRCRRLLLVVIGEAKRAALARAQQHNDPATWPICALLHHPTAQLEIHWSP